MRCSGSSKCNCTLFQGRPRTKKCKYCRHDRGSHYEPSNDNDDSDEDNGGNSNDDSEDDSDNNDDSDGAKQPSTSMKNKMTVSSLVANIIGSSKPSWAEVENAKREANAGLTRRQVGPTSTELRP